MNLDELIGVEIVDDPSYDFMMKQKILLNSIPYQIYPAHPIFLFRPHLFFNYLVYDSQNPLI